MEALLQRIGDGLARGAYPNERAVSTSIVVPILRALGWDDSDPEQVMPEYSSGKGRVDYALCISRNRPSVFIEVKGVGRSAEADRQLFEYAFHEGAPLAILTDGREWSFYLPAQQGSYDERRVYQLVLDEREPGEAAGRLIRYLERGRIASSKAFDDAVSDYRDARLRREASRTLDRAWDELLAGPDGLLMDLLSEKTEALCGFRPESIEIEEFLQARRLPLKLEPKTQLVARASVAAPSVRASASSQSERKRGGFAWRFGDRAGTGISQIAAFVAYVEAAFAQHPARLEQIIAASRTRSRNHIASSPEDIYPKRPDIGLKCHQRLGNGLLVGTNLSGPEKLKIAMQIAAAVDLTFGVDAALEV